MDTKVGAGSLKYTATSLEDIAQTFETLERERTRASQSSLATGKTKFRLLGEAAAYRHVVEVLRATTITPEEKS